MSTKVYDSLENRSPKHLDEYYGVFENGESRAYNSFAEVMAKVPATARKKGQIFWVAVNGKEDIYWFSGGKEIANLVRVVTSAEPEDPDPEPPVTNPTTGWRHITQADVDAGVIKNAAVGDYLITGHNVLSGSLRNISIRPTRNNVFSLDTNLPGSRKILIQPDTNADGQGYNRIEFCMPGTHSENGSPIIITNSGGQVKCKEFVVAGMSDVMLDFEHDPSKKTGDAGFRGHKDAYAHSSGKYGLYIDTQWTNKNTFALQFTGWDGVSFSNVGANYVEVTGGAFTTSIKYDNVTGIVDGVKLLNMYVHDIDSELNYTGSTQPDPQQQFRNVLIENGRWLRGGSDGIQINNMLDNCIVRNNVIHAGINWRDTFQANQDFGISMGFRSGGFQFKNNVVIGGAAFLQLFSKQLAGYTSSGLIDIDNNLWAHNVGSVVGYIGQTSFVPNISIRIANNHFAKRNYRYPELYSLSTNDSHLIRVANDSPLLLDSNKWDASQQKTVTTIVSGGYNPTITDTNNGQAEIPDIEFVNYMGFPVGFDYTRFSQWAALMGSQSAFSANGANKNKPITYTQDVNYVTHKSKIYKCILTHSTPVEPGVTGNGWQTYWSQVMFDGFERPADDVRLVSSNYHNSIGRGLLDNPAPVGTTCLTPALPQVTGVTPYKGTISWSHVLGYQSYDWRLRAGTSGGTILQTGNIVGNVVNLIDLTPETTYVPQVRTKCTNTGVSAWVDFPALITLAVPPPEPETVNIGLYDSGDSVTVKVGPTAALYGSGIRVASVGSSSLFGTGPTVTAEKFESRFQAELATVNGRFYNNGQGSTNTSNGMPTGTSSAVKPNINITSAISSRPDAIILWYPSNDIQDGFTPQQYADNLLAMFNECMKYGIPCFVFGQQPRDSYTRDQQLNLLQALALTKAVIPGKFFIDSMERLYNADLAATQNGKPANINPVFAAGDAIHLNGAGHGEVFAEFLPKFKGYFSDQSSKFDQYEISRAVVNAYGVEPSSWVVMPLVTDVDVSEVVYPRPDGLVWAYRMRARKVGGGNSWTAYSPTRWIQQQYLRVNVDQTIQIDFSVETNGPDTSGAWNTFNAPSTGAQPGAQISLTDINGTPTSVVAAVTKAFNGASTGGPSSGIYPLKVVQDYWSITRSNTDRGQIVISGLDARAYSIDVFGSRAGVITNRAIGIWVNGQFHGSPLTVPLTTQGNQNVVGTIEGVVPVAGSITIDAYSVGDLGALTALVIRRQANTALVCLQPTSISVGSITSVSAVVSLTPASGVATMDYELYTPAVSGGTLVTGDDFTGSSLPLNGLQPNTTYQPRYRTNCQNGVSSDWVNGTAFTTLAAPSGPANKVSVNLHFDANGVYQNANWNNWDVNASGSTPSPLAAVNRENGTLSPFSIAWGSEPYSSLFDNGASYGGGVFPAEILRQVLSTTSGPGFAGTRAGFIISGLNPAYNYDFELIGTRSSTGQAVQFQASGLNTVQSDNLITDSNKNNSVTILAVQPNGSGQITIKWGTAASPGFGFIAAFRMTENTGSTPTCAVPSGGSVTSVTQTTAVLDWADQADTTTFKYEVYAGSISGSPVKSGSPSSSTASITGLIASTTYKWRYGRTCSNTAESAWVNGPDFTTAGGGGGSSLASWGETSVGYDSGRPAQRGMLYTPPGYNDGNANLYPGMLFLHGSGEVGTSPSSMVGTGLPLRLNNGQVMKCVIFCPQLYSGANSWDPAVTKKAYDWFVANYRIDTSRVYITGLSLGATGAWFFVKAYPGLIAAYAVASGSAYTLDVTTEAAKLAIVKEIPLLVVHGDGDSGATNEANSADFVKKLNAASPKGFYSPEVIIKYNTGHNNSTWNDELYDTSKASLQFEDWFLLHQKNNNEYTANGYVGWVEKYVTASDWERALHQYTRAKALTDGLASGSVKTSLLNRLSTAKTTIDTANGKRHIINVGATTVPGNVNNITGATGTLANLVDYNGVAGGISLQVVTQTGAAASTPGIAGTYFGMHENTFADGRLVAGNGGLYRIANLNPAKTYDFFFIPSKDAVSAGNVLLSPEVTVANGTTVKWLLGSYNTRQYIKFSLTGSSSYDFAIKAGWTLNSGVTPSKDESGALVTTTANVANYTSRGNGLLSLIVITERP